MLIAQDRDVNLGGFDNVGSGYQIFPVGPNPDQAATQLELFFSNILAIITILSGLSFLLFFIFGTMQWIMAGGDEGRVENARKQMTQSALGLVVTLIAYSIMTIVSKVLGLNFLDINDAITRIAPI